MPELAPDARFGPYRIVRKLGEGGMGTVWEGVHEALKKRVAIKTLHADVSKHPEAVARFVREGQAAARLHHAHVVGVSDVGVNDDIPFLVMDYLEGESLAARISRDGPLDALGVIDVALPLMDALSTAHAEGIVHRDLKPDNILLKKVRGRGVHPVLLDFGISRLESGVDARLTKTSEFMGTPHYMSPEQARGAKNVDARSDQFSLALVLYEAASGKRAVVGDSVFEIAYKISSGEIPTLDEIAPELPAELRATIAKMMSTKATRRFPDLHAAGGPLLALASPRTQAVWGNHFGPGSSSESLRPPTIEDSAPKPKKASREKKPRSATESPRTSPATPVALGVTPRSQDTSTPFSTTNAERGRARASGRPWLLGGVVVLALGVAGGVAIWGSPPLPSTAHVVSDPETHVAAAPPPSDVHEIARGLDVPDEPLVALEDPSGAPPPTSADPAPEPPPSAIEVAEPPPSSIVEPATHGHGARPEPHPLEFPGRAMIVAEMNRVAPLARACGRIVHGRVVVEFTVSGATGHVSDVHATGAHAGTPVGQCIARALGTAHFPRFTRPTYRVSYPITI